MGKVTLEELTGDLAGVLGAIHHLFVAVIATHPERAKIAEKLSQIETDAAKSPREQLALQFVQGIRNKVADEIGRTSL